LKTAKFQTPVGGSNWEFLSTDTFIFPHLYFENQSRKW